MGRFGDSFEAEGAEGFVILEQFHTGLKFQHLTTGVPRNGLGGIEKSSGNAPTPGFRGDCDLAYVHARAANVRVGAPDKLTMLGCDEKVFPLRFDAEFVFRHPIQ